jgi:hypothetical protein
MTSVQFKHPIFHDSELFMNIWQGSLQGGSVHKRFLPPWGESKMQTSMMGVRLKFMSTVFEQQKTLYWYVPRIVRPLQPAQMILAGYSTN